MPEFVFTMHNVRKKLGEKLVLDNVTLSFFEGAKIGVVGPNGAGKSTMLKLMAGMLRPDNGDAMLAKEKSVGILLQEPPLTEGKTVLENIHEAVADTKRLIAYVATHGLDDSMIYTADRLADAWESEEGIEGIDSFLGKRAPSWRAG